MRTDGILGVANGVVDLRKAKLLEPAEGTD